MQRAALILARRTAVLSPVRSAPTLLQSLPCSLCAVEASEQPFSSRYQLSASSSSNSSFRSFFGGSAPESKTYSERRLVGYSPEQLYDVVSQVDQYQNFVPWCVKSIVHKKSGDNYFEAELQVGFQLFFERYTSKVSLEKPRLVRSEVSDHKLFDHLDSSWSMQPGPTPRTCWLSFNVDFAFRSPIYKHAAEVFFQEVVKQMMGAFEQRCLQLYGPSSLRRRAVQQSAPPASPNGRSHNTTANLTPVGKS